MKKYLLTKELIHSLLNGTKTNKEKIVLFLDGLLKKNESLFVTTPCINHILENEIHIKRRESIFRNIASLCDKIISLDKDDLPLIISYELEFNLDHFTAMEVFLAKKAGINTIVDITEKYNFQKMISVINLVLESE